MKKAVPDGCPAAIHDQQAGLNRGAVFGESAGGKRHGAHHDALAFERPPQIGVGKSGEGHDRRHPAAVRQNLERRDQMGLKIRERRVADHDVERPGALEEVG